MVRLGLSFLQVFGASLSLGLLLQLGVTRITLVVVVLTGLCTTASVVLFGGRHARRQNAPQSRRSVR